MQVLSDTSVVLGLLEELRQHEQGRRVTLRIGSVHGAGETVRRVFERFSEGTYLEDVELEIEEVPSEIGCGCGYSRRVNTDSYVPTSTCPRCGGNLTLTGGDEFEIRTS